MSRYTGIEPIDSWEDSTLWWRDNNHSFPGISRLARKYLAAPASSVPSERMFSSAGNFATKQRATLDADALEREVLLHHYLNEKNRLDSYEPKTTIPVLIQ